MRAVTVQIAQALRNGTVSTAIIKINQPTREIGVLTKCSQPRSLGLVSGGRVETSD